MVRIDDNKTQRAGRPERRRRPSRRCRSCAARMPPASSIVAFWDHWVPGANDVMRKLCQEWADKEKVDLKIDFVTSQGDKLMLTIAAEAQARSGHDMLTMPSWYAAAQTDNLEPADDIWAELTKRYGETSAGDEYLGRQKGHWIAPPAIPNTLTLPSVGRIDMFKEAVGLDLTQMYPAGGTGNKELTDKWTWDFFLDAAEKCNKAGHPFGVALGQTGDTANWVGAVFTAYGAELVDKDGNITVKSEPVKQVLEWFKKLVPNLPPDVFAWDEFEQQQGADLGPGGADLQPALGLGGGGARRAEGRRAMLALPVAEGPERPLRSGAAVLLGHLEILAEQGGGEELGAASVGEAARSSSSSPAAMAMTCRVSRRCATSRPGPTKARQKAASGTIRRAARSSSWCRALRRRPTSRTRSSRRRRWPR